ncbi:MAG: peptidoglycan D,D-transpeptidase FtsI family protein [Vulcanimicrobiaceae bacterium]
MPSRGPERSSGINQAIVQLGALFVLLFVVLAGRQVWLQVVAGPRLAQNVHNPRAALLAPYRGPIVARDGTVLAYSSAHGRRYPFGESLAHALGYASERYGTSGLEAVFDRDLAGRPVANDPPAQWHRIISRETAPAERGATVVTTIDPQVQSTLYAALSDYPRAAGIALDPRTGEVLALASVPSFDPAEIDREFASISTDARSPLLDRALDGLYPPGSTFKIVTASDALDSAVVTPEDTFYDPGFLKVGDFIVHDNEGEVTGTQDLAGAFALSSNVDFAQIAARLGADRWFDYAARWKLGEPIGFTLPVSRDHLPSPDSVTPSILAQLAFGQADLLVTPMRMALVGSTIAAGGNEPRPYLVRTVRAGDGRELHRIEPSTLAQPVSPETADRVRMLMIAVVRRGTGTAAALPGVQVAGKTGTATNPAGKSHAWFVAFAPAESPRVAVAIVVENVGYGGTFAAPIARKVLAVALARNRT